MFRIAICDDDKLVCSELDHMIKDYYRGRNRELTVDVYYSAKNLYDHIIGHGAYDMLFLDIEMEEVSGIDLGTTLRENEKDELTKIVFISHKDSYAMDLFRMRPQDFLKKPLKQKDVVYNIDKAIELLHLQKGYFIYVYDHQMKKVPISEIIYLESSNRVVNMYTIDGKKTFYEKLEDAAKRLDGKYFWRIHKSYIVHVLHIKKLEYKRVIMDNGEILGISQPYRPEVKRLQRELMDKG